MSAISCENAVSFFPLRRSAWRRGLYLLGLLGLLGMSQTGCNKKPAPKEGGDKQAELVKEGEEAEGEKIGEDTGSETKISDAPDPSEVPSGMAVVGQPLPAVGLTAPDGKQVQLRDLFFGKTGVVVFVGEDCPACVTELKKLDGAIKKDNLPVSVVVVGRDDAAAKAVLGEAGVAYPHFLDAMGEAGQKLSVTQKGTFFLIDNKGALQSLGQLEVDAVISGGGSFLDLLKDATRGKNPDPTLWDPDPWKRWAAGDVAKRRVAPDFSLQALNGKTYTLNGTLKQKNVVLVFFNRRCPHCTKELPHVQKFYAANAKKMGFEVLALTPSPDAAEDGEIRTYARDYGLTFPILTLREDNQNIFEDYGISSIPAWGVIGRDGKFRVSKTGEHPDIAQALSQGLSEAR